MRSTGVAAPILSAAAITIAAEVRLAHGSSTIASRWRPWRRARRRVGHASGGIDDQHRRLGILDDLEVIGERAQRMQPGRDQSQAERGDAGAPRLGAVGAEERRGLALRRPAAVIAACKRPIRSSAPR